MPERTGPALAHAAGGRSCRIPAVLAIGSALRRGRRGRRAAGERLAREGRAGAPPWSRTAFLAAFSASAAPAVAARSALPWWATAIYLLFLGILMVLTATDLEQRRLPHVLLDPLILVAAVFVPFNPGVDPLMALVGAAAAVGFLGALAVVVRGGVALGDLFLVAPIGFMLGWPAIFSALFAAAFLSAGASLVLLATRRVGMRSYIPFGPFLVGGAVIALLFDERVLGPFG